MCAAEAAAGAVAPVGRDVWIEEGPHSTVSHRHPVGPIQDMFNRWDSGMTADAGGSESKRERRFVAPFPGLAFTAAEKAGVGARSAMLWKTTRYGIAGTGKRIVELSGSAQTRAALAAIGKGPLVNGGKGMAGGLKKLGRIETAVAFTVAGAYVGAVLLANSELFTEKQAPVPEACANCRGTAADGGEAPRAEDACPQCAAQPEA